MAETVLAAAAPEPSRGVPTPGRSGWTYGPGHGTVVGLAIGGMDEPPELQQNRQWRTAVWALRAGFAALAVALVGIVLLSSGSTPWVLAVGVIGWLVAAAVTLTGVFRARSQLPEPRPGWWPLRFMLIHDTVHPRVPAPQS